MSTSTWARWSPVGGIVFVGLWVFAFAVMGSDDTHDTDAEIRSFYADAGHRHWHIASFFLILAAILFFVWFLGTLRQRLARAEGGVGVYTAVAFGAGLIATGLWLAADALWVAPALSVSDTHKFTLDPNTYRILENVGYTFWFSGTTVAAVLVAASGLLALRTGWLPKWLAWLSLPVAVTMLVAFFFIPFLIMLGWILVVSATLILRPAAEDMPAAEPGPM